MKQNLYGTLLPLMLVLQAGHSNFADAGEPYVSAHDVNWAKIPESYKGARFTEVFRYKTLIGGGAVPVQSNDVYFGEAELAPGAIYTGRKHAAPEIYYVISGQAEWTVGDKVFIAGPGTAIYTEPNTHHRMVNIGDTVLKTVWMWWGKPSIINQPAQSTEANAIQPAKAKFLD